MCTFGAAMLVGYKRSLFMICCLPNIDPDELVSLEDFTPTYSTASREPPGYGVKLSGFPAHNKQRNIIQIFTTEDQHTLCTHWTSYTRNAEAIPYPYT